MAVKLVYPDSKKRAVAAGSRAEAIERALREADERTVEVRDGDVLVARYEKRAAPLYADE